MLKRVSFMMVLLIFFIGCSVQKVVKPDDNSKPVNNKGLSVMIETDRKLRESNNNTSPSPIIVKGDPRRTFAMVQLIKLYWAKKDSDFLVDRTGTGSIATVSGPGGTSNIPLSDKILKDLEAMLKSPKAGQSIQSICARQADLLWQAMGRPIGEPKGKPTQGKCRSGKCYGHAPSGDYRLLGEIRGVKLMLNNRNANQPNDCITGKALYQNGQWIPIVTVRNTNDAQSLVDLHGARLAAYAKKVAERKVNDSGQEGDSCHEVFLSRGGNIIKGSVPSGLSL